MTDHITEAHRLICRNLATIAVQASNGSGTPDACTVHHLDVERRRRQTKEGNPQ